MEFCVMVLMDTIFMFSLSSTTFDYNQTVQQVFWRSM